LGYGRNYLWGRGECHGEAYDTETVGAKCRRRSVCDANECGGDLRRCSPSRGLNWPVAARPALRPAILAYEATASALFAKLCSKDLVAVVFEIVRGGNAAVVSHRPKKELGFAISRTHSNHFSFEVTAVLRISSWPPPDAQQAAPGSRTAEGRIVRWKASQERFRDTESVVAPRSSVCQNHSSM